jgi:predicted transcriptional regulator
MRVLLSVKPLFAEMIFNGTKKFEFRRTVFKNTEITTIVVYASFPIQKVIGEFKIDSILNEELDELWKKTKRHSGISEKYFYEYFQYKNKGYAIKIKETRRYEKELCLKENFNATPPQSFIYLRDDRNMLK